jgi:amidohydrolase
MHACGHDGHTAMLLAVARMLSLQRRDLFGEVRFLFQHAEEKPPGGGAELVAAGVLDGVDAIFGCHLWSLLQVGRVAALDGAFMAGGGTFEVTIKGRGGHAGIPQESIDPITTAAEAVSSLQHVVSRSSSPFDNVVVSITRITGGDADNVIPDDVDLGGTVRTFDQEVRDRTLEPMDRILQGVTKAHGATFKFKYVGAYDPVINDPKLARLVRETAAERTIKIGDSCSSGGEWDPRLG